MSSMSMPNQLVSNGHLCHLVNRSQRRPMARTTAKCTATAVEPSTVMLNFYFFNCICLLFILASHFAISNAQTTPALQSGLVDTPKASNQCIIGRLRQCNDDEDCVENASTQPEVRVIVSSSNGTANQVVHSHTFLSKPANSDTLERMGTCTCRQSRPCRRTQSQRNGPISESGKLADRRKGGKGGNLGLIFGTFIGIALIGGCSFAIYYYGFRYGMIQRVARQLGLTDNTQIEHQLLNRIPSGADDEAELAI